MHIKPVDLAGRRETIWISGAQYAVALAVFGAGLNSAIGNSNVRDELQHPHSLGRNRLCTQLVAFRSSWNSSVAGNASLWNSSHVATCQVNAMKREKPEGAGASRSRAEPAWYKTAQPTGLYSHSLLYCSVAIEEAAPKSRRRVCSEATAQPSIDWVRPGDQTPAGSACAAKATFRLP